MIFSCKHNTSAGPRKINSFLKSLIILCLTLCFSQQETLFAQVISNAGAAVTLTSGVVVESGDFENNSGSLGNEGTLNLSGDYLNAGPAVTAGNGYYNLKGDWTNFGIFNPDTSTVKFHGNTNDHSITHGSVGETFYKLTLNTPGKLVTHDATAGSVLTVIDSLNIFAGTLSLGSTTDSLSVRGNADIDGTLRFNNSTIQTSTITKNLSGTGTIDMSGGGRPHLLNLNGTTNDIGTLSTNPAGFSTVDYLGTTQTVFPSQNYRNLTISNTDVKTLQGNSLVGAELNVTGGIFDLGTIPTKLDVIGDANIATLLRFNGNKIKTVSIGGDLDGAGEIDMSGGNLSHLMNLYGVNNSIGTYSGGNNGTVDYTRTGDQNVFTSSTYRNLRITGSGTKILNSDITASGILTMLSGNINSNGNILKLTNSEIGAIIRQAGTVIGKLQRALAVTGSNYFYPIGTAGNYNPLNIKFQQLTPGPLTAQFKAEDIGSLGLPLDDDGNEVWDRFTQGYWNLNAVPPMASNNYNVNLNYNGFPILPGVDSSSRIIKRTDNGSLELDGINGSLDGTSISRNTLTGGISGNSTDFAIGKGRPKIDDQPENIDICAGSDAFFDINVRWHGLRFLKYQWQVNTGSGFTDIVNGGVYSGATSRRLVLTAADYGMNGYTYRVIITDRPGNTNISSVALLTVNKIPVATVSIPYQIVCDSIANVDVELGTFNDVTGTTFAWERTNPEGISTLAPLNGSGIIGTTISGAFKNTTDHPITIVYTIIPTGPLTTYCIGDAVTYSLVIQPTPRIFPVILNTIQCDSSTTAIQLRSPSTFTPDTVTLAERLITFNFTATATGGVTGFTASSAGRPNNFVITDTLINPTTSRQTVTYTLTPVSPFGCSDGPSQVFTVIVNPTPRLTALLAGHNVVCDTALITLNLTAGNGEVEGEKYYHLETSYTGDVTNVQASGYYPINYVISDILINDTKHFQTITYRIKPLFKDYNGIDLFDCDRGIDTTITITLNPTPFFDDIIVSDTVICNENSISFEFFNSQNTTGTMVFELIGTYTDTAVIGVKPDAQYGLDPFSDNLINISDSIQPVTYLFQPVISDPVNGLYCNKGIHTSRLVKVTPTLRSVANPLTYIGGRNIRCFGEDNGTIDIKPEGGYYLKDYIYSWTKDGVPFGTTTLEDPDKLKAGFYKYSIEDIIGCYFADSLELTEPKLLVVTDSTISQSCEGKNDGALYIDITGGTPGYNYRWQHDLGTPLTFGQDAVNLYYGYHNLTARDTNGCQFRRTYELIEPKPMLVTLDVKQYGVYNTSCFDASDGEIETFADANGSPANYKYYWTSDLGSEADPPDKAKISGLKSAQYFLTIVDSLECLGYADFSIIEPDPITVTRTGEYPTGFDITCYDRSDGIINLNVAGGHTTYLPVFYDWKMMEDPAFSSNKKNIAELHEGTFNVNIRDSYSCQTESSVTLHAPEEMVLTVERISDYNGYQVSCINYDNSVIDLSLVGGSGDYNFAWTTANGIVSNPSTLDQAGLPAGNYHLDVVDGINCPAEWDFVITEPDSIAVAPDLALKNGFEVSCFNGNDGSINLNTFGGVAPYEYSWSTTDGSGVTAVTENQSGLSIGTYSVSVMDNNNCLANWEFTLNQPEKLITTIDTTTITCFADNDGSADLTVYGGVEPYLYSWSNGKTSQDVGSLFIGEYLVDVTDANGCIVTDTAIVTEPAEIIIDLSVPLQYNGRMISCFGASDAIINSAVTGGKIEGIYQYLWSWDALQTTSISNVPAGIYYLSITDINQCVKVNSIVVQQPLKLVTDVFPTNPTCYGKADGEITLIVQGGTPGNMGYSIEWADGQLGQTADSIGMGQYGVVIRDLNNCRIDTFGKLDQPDLIEMTKVVNDPTCPDTYDGSIQYNIQGGTPPYDLFLNNIKVNELVSDLGQAQSPYYLVVTDNNQCVLYDTTVLKGLDPSCLTIPNAITPNGDGINDTWQIDDIELYPEAKIEIYNRWGELIYNAPKGYSKPWDGTFKGRQLPIDSYYYVIDLNNGRDVFSGNITIIR